HDRGEGSASDLTAAFLWIAIGLVVAAMAVSALLFPFVLPSISRGFDAGKRDLAFNVFYALLPVVAIGALSKFWLAILNGYEQFAAASLIPALVPVSVIATLMIAPVTARLEFLLLG